MVHSLRISDRISGDNISDRRNILVVRLDEIGDVVLTIPFLRELRKNLPNSIITLVVKNNTYNLVQHCPYVDAIVPFGRPVSGIIDIFYNMANAVRIGNFLRRRRHYDLAISPRWDSDLYGAGLLVYCSGAKIRVGYSEKETGKKRRYNKWFDHLFTHVIQDGSVRHEVEHNLQVIHYLGGTVDDSRLECWVGDEDRTFADEVFVNAANNTRIAFSPGARHRRRMWPLDNFIAAASWCKDNTDARILVIGGAQDRTNCELFATKIGDNVINLAGKATLRQTAAVLGRCDLLVSNDSGPVHIAASMGIPVVVISCHPVSGEKAHMHSPARFGPWNISATVLQPAKAMPPCAETCSAQDAHCIRTISVEAVCAAIEKHLVQNGIGGY